MKRIKLLFYIGLVASISIMMSLGTVYGDSVTLQREAGLQTGQESTVVKDTANRDGSQLTFSPLRLRDKTDAGGESEAADRAVKMERYKPYREGEGERKIR